jgi:hypothetical protein
MSSDAICKSGKDVTADISAHSLFKVPRVDGIEVKTYTLSSSPASDARGVAKQTPLGPWRVAGDLAEINLDRDLDELAVAGADP